MPQTQTSQAKPAQASPTQQPNAMPVAGQNVAASNTANPGVIDADNSGKKTWLWWVIGILAVLIIISLVYFFLF